ncbi:hypothetical protein MKX01_023417 [Papaver californicum]|nr:hypothetical protein MKX01_023417 [Papaver californicum]
MYLKVELSWNVVVPAEQMHGERLLLQRSIMLQLFEDFSNCRIQATFSSLLFSTVTFKPFEGDILYGVVNSFMKLGVCLSCGPIEKVFLSVRKMGDYHHFPGEKQAFQNGKGSKIEDVQVRFKVLATEWRESKYFVLGTLEGDYLGPIYRGQSKF